VIDFDVLIIQQGFRFIGITIIINISSSISYGENIMDKKLAEPYPDVKMGKPVIAGKMDDL